VTTQLVAEDVDVVEELLLCFGTAPEALTELELGRREPVLYRSVVVAVACALRAIVVNEESSVIEELPPVEVRVEWRR
jgi:hypothetical protein